MVSPLEEKLAGDSRMTDFQPYYLTGKYPISVTYFCPSGLRIQSIYDLVSPVGRLAMYMYKYLVIGYCLFLIVSAVGM